jgi:hypothetical protein
MNNALDNYIDTIMEKHYPEKSIPHWVARDIFIPWMRAQIKTGILGAYEYNGGQLYLNNLLRPFQSIEICNMSSSEYETVPDDVIDHISNIKNLKRKRNEMN